jgi:hypothetical protein
MLINPVRSGPIHQHGFVGGEQRLGILDGDGRWTGDLRIAGEVPGQRGVQGFEALVRLS